jgi:hypothetical protein
MKLALSALVRCTFNRLASVVAVLPVPAPSASNKTFVVVPL